MSIVAVEQIKETSIAVGSLADYSALIPGSKYFWRVTAIDSSELKLETVSEEIGQFYYNPAMLSIDANMPDAKIYLGGNAAYSGHFIGNTPLQLQDVAAGPYTVVIERAGCETFISQVEISKGGYVSVNANLLLAVAPELTKATALRSIKTQLKSAAQVAPFIVDFNNDDMADLLVGDEAGAVSLFTALAKRGSKFQYGAAESLEFGRLPGTALFVADWNNDNKKDVLVGDANGNVSIYQQSASSSDLAPEFDSVLFLRNGNGAVIDVGSQANPAVVDFDQDGDKDLVVGTGKGELYLYLNNGSDATPELASYPKTLTTFSSSVSPMFVDWDADGQRDLLVSVEGSLYRCLPQNDGSFLVEATALVDAAANGIESGARYFVVDSDNGQGKDVYIGLVGGEVQLMRSAGKEFLPAVTGALLDKLTQVSDLAVAAEIDVATLIANASTQISEGDFNVAAQSARDIADVGSSDAELYDAAVELVALLNQ
ncbi:MAG: hypothetical protein C0615_08840 [Desulfuromonas sp.]|nr:MAG: hypothetical protein C0615_08840 [Desulfuromonas sp.]